MTDHMDGDDKTGHSSSTQVARSDKSSNNSGSSLGKLVGWGVAAAAAYAITKQWPEVQRYLKMRQM
ncbi:MAG: DUF6893 family small protein [Gemmatimonadaceae bacterium]